MIRVVEALPERKRSKATVSGISRAIAAAGVAVVVAAVAAMIPAFRAAACSCYGGTPTQYLRNASVAFVGVVAAGPHLRKGGTWPILYRFGVEKVVKGNPGDWIDIATGVSGASCGAGFVLGSRWRVYAWRDRHGVPVSTSCSGNALIDLVAPVSSGVPYPSASVPELAPLKLPSSPPRTPLPAAANPSAQASRHGTQSHEVQNDGIPAPILAGAAGLALLIALGGAWALRRRSAPG